VASIDALDGDLEVHPVRQLGEAAGCLQPRQPGEYAG
jgi:hypothetical protein